MKIVDAIELMARGRRGEPIPAPATRMAASARGVARYDAVRAGARRAAVRGRPRAPGAAARRRHVVAARAGAGGAHRRHACAGAPRRGGGRHRGRRARRALVRADRPRLAGVRRGGRGGALRRRRAGGRRRGRPSHGARGGRAGGRRLRGAGAGARPGGGAAPRRRPGEPQAPEPPLARRSSAAATRMPRSPPARTWSRHLADAAHRAPVSRARERPGRAAADGRLHLYTQGQGIFDDRRQVAAFLGVPEDQLFVELVPNGGAFGGKEDMSVQAQTALLAQRHRPAGQAHAEPRGVDPPASEAPSRSRWTTRSAATPRGA